MKTTRISPLAAWALAFGCALGWDSFVLPWTTFLPKAGPLGTVLGILIGAVVMVVVAWNYHCMINQSPGPGGAYAYASKAFGGDHGFLCAWFLCLAYVAILWMDAAVLVIRANPAWASMRVVVATADVEYRGKFAEMGFDDLLLKPITVEKLAKVVSGRAQP